MAAPASQTSPLIMAPMECDLEERPEAAVAHLALAVAIVTPGWFFFAWCLFS